MFAANPSVANAAGYASAQTLTSGPGVSEYGASAPPSCVQTRLRNIAVPPRPSCNAGRTTVPAAPSSGGGAFAAFAGFLTGLSSSGSGAGGGAFFSSASSASGAAFLLAGFSSSSSDADSSGGGSPRSDVDFDFDPAAGGLCFLPPFFFFASADSEASITSSATKNASPRAAVRLRARAETNDVDGAGRVRRGGNG